MIRDFCECEGDAKWMVWSRYSIDLCLYTIHTRHAENEQRLSVVPVTKKMSMFKTCVHVNETKCQIKCYFVFMRLCYIHWIEVPILTSFESVLIERMHLNFVNEVVAVITFNQMEFTVENLELCCKITIILPRNGKKNMVCIVLDRVFVWRLLHALHWHCSQRTACTSNWKLN